MKKVKKTGGKLIPTKVKDYKDIDDLQDTASDHVRSKCSSGRRKRKGTPKKLIPTDGKYDKDIEYLRVMVDKLKNKSHNMNKSGITLAKLLSKKDETIEPLPEIPEVNMERIYSDDEQNPQEPHDTGVQMQMFLCITYQTMRLSA